MLMKFHGGAGAVVPAPTDKLTSAVGANSTLTLTDDATNQFLTGNLGDLRISAQNKINLGDTTPVQFQTLVTKGVFAAQSSAEALPSWAIGSYSATNPSHGLIAFSQGVCAPGNFGMPLIAVRMGSANNTWDNVGMLFACQWMPADPLVSGVKTAFAIKTADAGNFEYVAKINTFDMIAGKALDINNGAGVDAINATNMTLTSNNNVFTFLMDATTTPNKIRIDTNLIPSGPLMNAKIPFLHGDAYHPFFGPVPEMGIGIKRSIFIFPQVGSVLNSDEPELVFIDQNAMYPGAGLQYQEPLATSTGGLKDSSLIIRVANNGLRIYTNTSGFNAKWFFTDDTVNAIFEVDKNLKINSNGILVLSPASVTHAYKSLDMTSGNGYWFRPPQMTTEQRNTMISSWGSGDGGKMWFNVTTNQWEGWDGYSVVILG